MGLFTGLDSMKLMEGGMTGRELPPAEGGGYSLCHTIVPGRFREVVEEIVSSGGVISNPMPPLSVSLTGRVGVAKEGNPSSSWEEGLREAMPRPSPWRREEQRRTKMSSVTFIGRRELERGLLN
jgi:hypothetical protein